MTSPKAASGLNREASPGILCSPQLFRMQSGMRRKITIEAGAMQNIRDILKYKEEQLEQLLKEIDALRLSVQILEQEERESLRSRITSGMPSPASKDNGTRTDTTTVKQFP